MVGVQSVWLANTAIFWYIATAFFAALILLSVSRKHRKLRDRFDVKTEVIRFVCLSGIAISFIFSLYFTNHPIGVNGPLGLVLKPPLINGNLQPTGEWVINLGGNPPKYTEGVQVPISVAVFGILGSYARYLYEVRWIYPAKSRVDSEWGDILLDNGVDDINYFKHTLRDVSFLIIAPVLSMTIYTLLFQGGASVYAIAAVSFTIGLITREVTLKLIDFTRTIFGIKGIAVSKIRGGPTITNVHPPDGAPDVPIYTALHAKFNETIKMSTVTSSTFGLRDLRNKEVEGIVHSDGINAIFKPTRNLDYNTEYTATITTGVSDKGGNSMLWDKTWSFKTESDADETRMHFE